MILIKENVEKIVDDASRDIIDRMLHNGWSEVHVTDPKPKSKRGVKKSDDQTS